MTAFFRVGRCVMRDEIRDPTVASVRFCARSSSPMTTDGVEFKRGVEGDDRVCGSALTRQRNASAKVNARLRAPMMLRCETLTQNVVAWFFLPKHSSWNAKAAVILRSVDNDNVNANSHLWVCPSFSCKWLSSGVVKIVSKNVCPLRWLQRCLPDCIRDLCGEGDYPPPKRLRSPGAAGRAFVLPSRHPRILVNLLDVLWIFFFFLNNKKWMAATGTVKETLETEY